MLGTAVVGSADCRTAADRTGDRTADRLGNRQLRSSGRIRVGHTAADRILGIADRRLWDRNAAAVARRSIVGCSWILWCTLAGRLTRHRLRVQHIERLTETRLVCSPIELLATDFLMVDGIGLS